MYFQFYIKYLTDIALECAGFLNGLGCDATILARSVVLRGFDQQMVELIVDSMVQKGITIKMDASPLSIKQEADGKLLVQYTVGNKDDEALSDSFDTVLFAIGHCAALQGLRLENAGVKVTSEQIEVDDNSRTNIENVFAVAIKACADVGRRQSGTHYCATFVRQLC